MRFLLITLTALILAGCNAVPVKNVQEIKTVAKLNKKITTPVNIPVAYYAEEQELTRIMQLNSGGGGRWIFPTGQQFKEALDLVLPGIFARAEPLKLGGKPKYLFRFSGKPEFDSMFGTATVTLSTSVTNRSGDIIYETQTEGSSSTGGIGGGYETIFMNAFAQAIKEATTRFLNHTGSVRLAETQNAAPAPLVTTDNVLSLLDGVQPVGTGTGFFMNKTGQILTASHVINGCLLTQIKHEDKTYNTKLAAQSRILDTALLEITNDDFQAPEAYARISTDGNVTLGTQVFTTGYPLSSVLSAQANLTLGNISSLGGLKGAIGAFQYSAPIQSGSSGGPIVDYNGQLIGLVTSTINEDKVKSAGATTQNINFGLSNSYIIQFLNNNNITYSGKKPAKGFEKASQQAVAYTIPVLCYK
ncbi:S1 family peptidase [Aliamphritea ceti]|uniref:S1 family peptidase n=1 Tax=Aliamphritea ceti TaxID=1524258 RepID=UPI0021C38BA8|nr:serine protease [Aliamphritea ceti]